MTLETGTRTMYDIYIYIYIYIYISISYMVLIIYCDLESKLRVLIKGSKAVAISICLLKELLLR